MLQIKNKKEQGKETKFEWKNLQIYIYNNKFQLIIFILYLRKNLGHKFKKILLFFNLI